MTDDNMTADEAAAHPESDEGANAAALEHITRTIRAALAKGQSTGMEALTSFRDTGEALAEAKQVLPKGAFGPWSEETFGFSKEWRARLMRLADRWSDVVSALGWAKAQGRILGRREYSVDGALALVTEHLKATTTPTPEAEAEATAKAEAKARAKAEKEAEAMSEAEALRAALAEAMALIRKLERENAKLRNAAGGAEAPKSEPGADAAKVSAAHKGTLRKLHALWSHANTGEGEASAAKARGQALADKYGMTLEAFCAACGVSL